MSASSATWCAVPDVCCVLCRGDAAAVSCVLCRDQRPSAIARAFFAWLDFEEGVVQQGRKGLIFLMISSNNERPYGVYPSISCSWLRQVHTLSFEPIKHELVDGIEQFLVTVVHCGIGIENWSDVDHRLEEFDVGQDHFGEVLKRKFIKDLEACQVCRQRALLKEGYPVEVRFLPCKLQDDIRPSVVDLPCQAERFRSANPEVHVRGIFYVQPVLFTDNTTVR